MKNEEADCRGEDRAVMKKIGAQSHNGQFAFRENPKLHAAVESHPNVEKHDVRMGQPASR